MTGLTITILMIALWFIVVWDHDRSPSHNIQTAVLQGLTVLGVIIILAVLITFPWATLT